ncbi:MAG: response regulator transcription factor [Leptospiraceae bacterium]|nr:response regulator transcription factor [Leptospiraceae bacterium]
MAARRIIFGIVENDKRFLGTVVNLLKLRKDTKEILEFTSAEEILSYNELDKLDLIIVDYKLSGMDGISLLGQEQIRNLKIPKLILSGFNAEERIFDALKFGATGYMFKNEIYYLDSTIDILLAGEASITPLIALRIVQSFKESAKSSEEFEPLTSREMQILKELSNGYPLKQISETLDISINTIRVHIRNIYKKLEVNNQIQLLKKAKQINLL